MVKKLMVLLLLVGYVGAGYSDDSEIVSDDIVTIDDSGSSSEDVASGSDLEDL